MTKRGSTVIKITAYRHKREKVLVVMRLGVAGAGVTTAKSEYYSRPGRPVHTVMSEWPEPGRSPRLTHSGYGRRSGSGPM